MQHDEGQKKVHEDVEVLIEALRDTDDMVRQGWAAIALGQLGDVRAVEPLIEALRDKYGEVRLKSAVALGQLEDVRAVEPLIKLLSDNNRWVRRQAARALGMLGWKPASDTESAWLAIAQQDWDEVLRLGSVTVEPLIEALRGEDTITSWHAAIILKQLGDVRVVEQLGEVRVVKLLIELLSAEESEVRRQAARILGMVGWKPVNDTESARLAIAQQDWEKVLSLGLIAVEPLIAVLKQEKIGDPRGIHTLLELEGHFPMPSPQAPPPPSFTAPPSFTPSPSFARWPSFPIIGKWQGGIIVLSVICLIISVVAMYAVKMTKTEHVPPATGPWNVLLFVCQMILFTTTVCFTPTCVSLFLRRSGRIVSVLTESVTYIVVFVGFAFWLFGMSAFGYWLFYAVVLILLVELGSRYIEWYKGNTLKRIRHASSYASLEIDVKALEKMARDEVILYIAVPAGLALGTVAGLILHQTTVQIIVFCLQLVLLFASFILLYFLVVSFLRMADPLFKTTPKFLPALTTPKQKGKRKPKASQASQERIDQQYIDVASDVSGLRMVYKYNALHNTILLVACIVIFIKIWLVPIDTKWLIASFLFASLVCSEIPYAIGQYMLHTRILEEYTGAKYVEMTKKLQDYASIFPPKAFLGALLTTGVTGGILNALLSQMVQDAIATLIK